MADTRIPLMVQQIDPVSPLIMLQQGRAQQEQQRYERQRQQNMDAMTIADLNQQREARDLQMQGQRTQNKAADVELQRESLKLIARDAIAANDLIQAGDLQSAAQLLQTMKRTSASAGLPTEDFDEMLRLFNTPDQLKTESANMVKELQPMLGQIFQDVKDGQGNIIGQRNTETNQLSAAPEGIRPAQPSAAFEVVKDANGNPIAQRNTQTGQVSALPDTMTPAKPAQPTSTQSVAAGYAQRTQEAGAVLDALGSQFTGTGARMDGYMPRELQSADRQKFDQASRNFINATLRRESGAVISPEEFTNARLQYIPQPGDSKEVLEQKRRNREVVAVALRTEAGPALDALNANLPPARTGNTIGRFQVEVIE